MIDGIFRFLPRRWSRRPGVLRTIVGAFGLMVGGAEQSIQADALRQLSILTADGPWLEYWADRFGIRKYVGESNNGLRSRVTTHLSRPKSTVSAIADTIRPFIPGEPVVSEVAGGTVVGNTNYTATDYSYDGKANTVIVEFRPYAFTYAAAIDTAAVIDPSTMPAGRTVFDYRGAVADGGALPPNVRLIFDEIAKVKANGTKVVLKVV